MYRKYRIPFIHRELLKIQNELDRFQKEASSAHSQRPLKYPAINIWSDEKSAFITAEIPGVDQDDLEIAVTGDTLQIRGSRQPDTPAEGARYHRQERNYGDFKRDIRLPFTVEVNKVKADLSLGVLKVFLPREESESPKKISVSVS